MQGNQSHNAFFDAAVSDQSHEFPVFHCQKPKNAEFPLENVKKLLDIFDISKGTEDIHDVFHGADLFLKVRHVQNAGRRVNHHTFVVFEAETLLIAQENLPHLFFLVFDDDFRVIRVEDLKKIEFFVKKSSNSDGISVDFDVVQVILRVRGVLQVLVFDKARGFRRDQDHFQDIAVIAE